MLFTISQLTKIASILDKTHILFIGSQLGSSVLSDDDKIVLKRNGIDVDLLPKTGKVDTLFKFGVLAESLGKKGLSKLSFERIKEIIEKEQYIPLTNQQEFALKSIRGRAYSDIKKLSGKINSDISNVITEQERQEILKRNRLIRKEARKAIASNMTVSQLSSELGKKTGDWSRDFDRISDYVLHEAFDMGKAMSVLEREGSGAKVYKEVYPGACIHCQSLYLTAGIGSKPILFNIEELISNGTNIGRKTKQWKAVVGPTHPWCRCELVNLPDGYDWSPEMRMFVPVRISRVKRKSRVKITIS